MHTTRERRAIIGNLELRSVTDAEKTAGYIGALEGKIPFNADSQVLRDRTLNSGRPFVERIAPGAFTRSLAEVSDIMGFVGHTDDPLAAFARIGENLSFTAAPDALCFRALLPDTPACRALSTLTDKKIIRGTSFEFDRGATDKWEKRDGLDVRTVTEGTLRTVNPVAWPAYDGSELTVDLRARSTAARGAYFCPDCDYDPTITDDTSYALDALCDELDELTDALEYLRACPGGALADYANREKAESAAAVTELVAFLVANGAQVDPAMMNRAQAKLSEVRAAAPGAKPITPSSAREERLRMFTKTSK